MCPFRKRSPTREFEKDVDKLIELDKEVMEAAVANFGKVNRVLSQRFVDQYLVCRRRYGEPFLQLVRQTFIPIWKEDADIKMSLERNLLVPSQLYQATLLSQTGECPEMLEVHVHLSEVARRWRGRR